MKSFDELTEGKIDQLLIDVSASRCATPNLVAKINR